jgi:hypothetical protein
MKPVLMIHDFKREYLNLPLKDYTLSFDDGLVSPFSFWGEIANIPTTKMFFITTSVFKDGFEGRPPQDFLSVSNVRFLKTQPDVIIGGHSHMHTDFSKIRRLSEKTKGIDTDTKAMLEWFRSELGMTPTHFCMPYNQVDPIYQSMLMRIYGIPNIYGRGRIDIERLLYDSGSGKDPYSKRC